MWEIADILKINKVIGENEKCIFYFMEKPYGIFGQPNTFNKFMEPLVPARDFIMH